MKIQIGKYVWTVEYVEHLFNSFGNTSFSELSIKISKNQPKVLLKDTIFHETLHAYIKSFGFNKDYFYEEEMVTFITQNTEAITSISNEIMRRLK